MRRVQDGIVGDGDENRGGRGLDGVELKGRKRDGFYLSTEKMEGCDCVFGVGGADECLGGSGIDLGPSVVG